MITIPSNPTSRIRILAKPREIKPKKRRMESTSRIGVSIEEAASMLGVSRMTFLPLIKEGTIRTVRIRKRVIVSVQSLRDFVDGKNTPCDPLENSDESPVENPQKH
jgi:excisionase family DNA binding protein